MTARGTPMQSQTVEELRALAKRLGLTGYSKLRKQELLELLAAHRPALRAAGAGANGKRKVRRAPAPRRDESRPVPAAPAATAPPPETEQQIESAKFAFAPPGAHLPEPAPAVDLGEDIDRLPAIGEPLLCLLPQKPGILHGYWVIPTGLRIPSDTLRLRLARFAGEQAVILEELPLPSARGHWYFHLDAETDYGMVYLQLGYYAPDGRFVTAFHRGIARIPSLYASSRTDRLWWVSEERFRAMYLRAGGYARGLRLGWSAASSSPGERLAWPGGVSSR